MRDMTERQFQDALKRHGMTDDGFMGYVNIPISEDPLSFVSVCRFNAGANRRAQLAYLLAAQKQHT